MFLWHSIDHGSSDPLEPALAGEVVLRLKGTPPGWSGPHCRAFLRGGKLWRSADPSDRADNPDDSRAFDLLFVDAWGWMPTAHKDWPEAEDLPERFEFFGSPDLRATPVEVALSACEYAHGYFTSTAYAKGHPLYLAEQCAVTVGYPSAPRWPALRRSLFKARCLHPSWTDVPELRAAVLLEEAGEVARAWMEARSGKAPVHHVEHELADLAAVLVRWAEGR